ncbi:MoaD/ThiS family protein [Amphiplicatus metriothermophilus]|uniref:Molybdopterin synthase subunit MoaD n=1 Tax=Amphiplicatus metriothermophilus TaxID=1519374 RepID=A0A239PSY6_9PROT|nr:MoaD/ThiS family protein [Amphiplicatus metriothermophilus]MBB5519325.1 molybdopterin synthase sulfur carrier subunit [Amphiplicatus metriothermophilus]SNT73401.1 molybdopterin synthase subunit MoaD [Amphiplicatus metriothermophilus]
MAIRVLFFGRLHEVVGAREREIEPPDWVDTPAALIDWLAAGDARIGAALSAPSVRVAVDQAIVERDSPLAGAREVAFMPPFSGG